MKSNLYVRIMIECVLVKKKLECLLNICTCYLKLIPIWVSEDQSRWIVASIRSVLQYFHYSMVFGISNALMCSLSSIHSSCCLYR